MISWHKTQTDCFLYGTGPKKQAAELLIFCLLQFMLSNKTEKGENRAMAANRLNLFIQLRLRDLEERGTSHMWKQPLFFMKTHDTF